MIIFNHMCDWVSKDIAYVIVWEFSGLVPSKQVVRNNYQHAKSQLLRKFMHRELLTQFNRL